MFALWLSLAASETREQFLEFSRTKSPFFNTSSKDDLEKIRAKYPNFVLLSAAPDFESLIQDFARSRALFFSTPMFHATPHDTLEIFPDMQLKTPGLIFINNSKVIASIGPLNTDTELLTLIDLFLNRPRPVYTSYESLISALGMTPLTIISSPLLFEKALSLAVSEPLLLGPINVILASNSLLGNLGLSEGEFAMHRSIDNSVEVFDGSVVGLIEASKPLIHSYTIREMETRKRLTVGLLCNSIEEEHKDFLYGIAERFRSIDVTILGSEEKESIEELTLRGYPDRGSLQVAVFNLSGRYFYPVAEYLPKVSDPFNSSEWIDAVSHAIIKIGGGKIAKAYRSEGIPRKTERALQKVVGLNFMEFISKSEEVLMLFVRYGEEDSNAAFRIYSSFTESEVKRDGIIFGFIDTISNAIDGGFPVPEEGPKVGLYAGGKWTLMKSEITSENLIEFLRVNTGSGNNSMEL